VAKTETNPMQRDSSVVSVNAKPDPSEAEQRAMLTAYERIKARDPSFDMALIQEPDGTVVHMGPSHNDHQGWLVRLESAFGTGGKMFAFNQLNLLMPLCMDKNKQIDTIQLNGMLAAIEAARPRNELEAMLAVQMVMTHELAGQFLRRAQKADMVQNLESSGSLAIKLLRTFTGQIEALAKLQRGGEQVVRVVHVHSGGQAIVGNVATGASGGGGATREN
jgi:hypothetical protein